jgi:holo-[acyl-carrier protein] synthase
MTQYIGIDIIEIARIEKAISRWGEPFLRRIYTDAELERYRRKPASLAARFAGKEAVMKLLGTDIETLSHPSGKPVLNLYGGARSHAAKLGIEEIAVSLSHSREYAIVSVAGMPQADRP